MQAIDFDPSCSGQTHSNRLYADLRNVDSKRWRTVTVFCVHVKIVHWPARMPNPNKLSSNFYAAGTNKCLDFSLSLLAACDSDSWPRRMWPGSEEL